MAQDKYEQFRQFIADFLTGPNADAMVKTLADDAEKLQNLSIAVTDQLTISTASGIYLDKRLADKGVTRPPELGMSDLSFRRMGIQITAAKQITELIHVILETFYGEETVRANLTNTLPGPYNLDDGMELFFELEDGSTRTVSFASTDFRNINQATAGEVADVITRFIRTQNLKGFAKVVIDLDTNDEFVQLFGGAKGPYSTVTVTGGEANTRLQFPNIRGTELGINNTAWEITRTVGSTLRFRWVGNSKPALSLIFPGDRVMIYGNNFSGFELDGTFIVSNVRPPVDGPDLEAGWFEIENDAFSGLRSTQPGTNPPPNVPPDTIYSYTVCQAAWTDLMFMKPIKALPNRQVRYALAWEPRDDLLRIYMPATTGIVARNLIGATHRHNLYEKGNLDGSFGSTSDATRAVEVVSDRIVRFRQLGYDNYGSGGVLTWGANTIPIDYVRREQFFTTVVCAEPHGLPITKAKLSIIDQVANTITVTTATTNSAIAIIGGEITITGTAALDGIYVVNSIIDQNNFTVLSSISQTVNEIGVGSVSVNGIHNRTLTNEIISVLVERMAVDAAGSSFPSPYVVDPEVNYTVRSEFVTSRQKVFAGSTLTTLDVNGVLPNEPGVVLFDLNKDTEEGPIRYVGVQTQNAPTIVNIVTISQNGFIITMTTDSPHGAIPGANVVVNGTSVFDGVYPVNNVPNPTTIVAVSTTAQVANQVGAGTVGVLVENLRSTLLLDPSNDFQFNHEIGSDLTLMSNRNAYEPNRGGTDYPLYVTGVAEGRVFANEVIVAITALGINLEVIIVYPDDTGLGNQGGSDNADNPPASDKIYVWGV